MSDMETQKSTATSIFIALIFGIIFGPHRDRWYDDCTQPPQWRHHDVIASGWSPGAFGTRTGKIY